jgi:hypothetical protein
MPQIQPHILRDSSGGIGRYCYRMLRVQTVCTRVVLLLLSLRFVSLVSKGVQGSKYKNHHDSKCPAIACKCCI